MRTVLLYNPKAGRGRAERVADLARQALERLGHGVTSLCASNGTTDARLRAALDARSLLVVVGGDGTLHSAIDAAVATGAAVYQLPLGTENLFAREFAMSGGVGGLCAALERPTIRAVDIGRCNGRTFLLMCSVGSDAAVVHRLAARRNGRITHLSYLRPTFEELVGSRCPVLTIRLDGVPIVEGRPGLVVIANCGRYGLRMDPAPRAEMDDGLLDIAFIPGGGPTAVLGKLLHGRLVGLDRVPGVVHARGAAVSVESAVPAAVQLDGEVPGSTDGPASIAGTGGHTPVRAGVEPGRLRVLLSAQF